MINERSSSGNQGRSGTSRRLVAQTFVSMDGVMQAPGGPEEDTSTGFRHGGWSMTYWDEGMDREMGSYMAQPYELLLGRRTYDIFAGYWPAHREEPAGASINGARKYVASRTRTKLDWENSTLLAGDAVAAVRDLKRRPGPEIRVVGSGALLQALLAEDLVDGLTLWVFPVVLGSGRRLFDSGAIPTAWKLLGNKTSGTGVVMQDYERSGAISYGRAPGT